MYESMPRMYDGSLEPVWIAEMQKWLGIAELVKGKLNPVIRQMFASTHFPPDKVDANTPWCSAALCDVMERLGLGSPASASAMSWLKYGAPCAYKPGAIVVFGFKSKHDTGPTDHHVSIVVGKDRGSLLCVGGNQSSTVKRSWYSESAVLGMRWPE